MSATKTPTAAAGDKSYEEIRARWAKAHIRPLWENPIAHKARDGGPRPHLWKWDVLRPAVAKLFGKDPEAQIREDLSRFKSVMEAGEIATVKGQPSGRR